MTPRAFAAFAVAFAVVFALTYVVSVESNLALFTYHPALGEWGAGVEKGRDGPAMYWFGWLATSTLVATGAGAVAAWLPESVTRRLPPALAWITAVGAMVAFCYLLREFFLR